MSKGCRHFLEVGPAGLCLVWVVCLGLAAFWLLLIMPLPFATDFAVLRHRDIKHLLGSGAPLRQVRGPRQPTPPWIAAAQPGNTDITSL